MVRAASDDPQMLWQDPRDMTPQKYTCGYCGSLVGSEKGYRWINYESKQRILICPHCLKPTFFELDGKQHPGPRWGVAIEGIKDTKIERLYEEARNCMASNSFTAAVLCCRKLLMNIAVQKGAKKGLNFFEYVEYLSKLGYVPPDGKEWVDHIRTKSNEANHEIQLMSKDDAEELLTFIGMLLKFIYEFPEKMVKHKPI